MTDYPLGRRQLLAGGGALAGLSVLGACTSGSTSPAGRDVGPGSPEVAAAEARRRTGNPRVVAAALTAVVSEVDLGGPVVRTWTYGGVLPGRLLRARAGDVLRVRVHNGLPADTSVHWHGIAVRNDMDGVPGITQRPIRAGTDMTYDFAVPDPGTYWLHPHVGTQLDRGLYAPLIIDDPAEPGDYDAEFVVVLDDWLDGTGRDPDQVLAGLLAMSGNMGGGAMPGMGGGSTPGMAMPFSAELGGDAGDVTYPHYLINGRIPAAPVTLRARPRQTVRLRIINAGSDTAFRVALGGHRLTVTHTDGFPVRPVTVDALLLGMGERYDATVTLADGAFPLVAVAEGKGAQALAVLRTGTGPTPTADSHPAELDRRLLRLDDLRATAAVALPDRDPDRTHTLTLGGGMMPYRWTINGTTYDQSQPLPARAGETVRLRLVNQTTMFHPMHVHGHTLAIRGNTRPGPRKDTVIVHPHQTVAADLVADNPGQWATHCHNAYHAEAGMMTRLSYQR
jgi:FtsP/CotA-like multicopper oxidase with cupredoxin domain